MHAIGIVREVAA
jgi:hypothetical protein